MGIFGALTTAVAGMRAQAFALENVSGNIANSQTTAFKRMDTSFQDLIPDSSRNRQLAGSVTAQSRATNTVQGDLQASSLSTSMAINGAGFFVVQKPSGYMDGQPSFDGIDLYSRRGDFAPDKNGYLVNGAGYYLLGVPIDPSTGNPAGSVPQLLQFKTDFLPAQPSTQIDYRLNLPSYPQTLNADKNVPGSELINPASFISNPLAGPPQPARLIGNGANVLPDAAAISAGTSDISALASAGGTLELNGVSIPVAPGSDAAAVLAAINAQTGTTGVSASLNSSNQLVLTGGDAHTAVTIGAASSLGVLGELGLGVGVANPTNLLSQSIASAGQTMTITVGGNPPLTITFGTGTGEVSTLAQLSAALGGLTGGAATVNTANGNITITAGNMTDSVSVGGTATPANFGLQVASAVPSDGSVIGDDVNAFLNSSIGGGAVTAYDASGAPVNIQVRWVKTASSTYGGTDTWNMFYQVNSGATGSDVAWKNVGVDYTFGANRQMDPPVANVQLQNVTVNGVSLGNLTMSHGVGGVTHFADANGLAQINLLQQNGFPAGDLQGISVSDKGRIVGTYSNGRTIDLAEITLANFQGANYLKRLDGGAFEATAESGVAIYGGTGQIIGSTLEGSNTDIADEFTKLIITQQAYSANTKVITSSNQMVQDLLNMLR
ncbi:MAG TPA: flagellar hook-basal body complex protein [Xanthobacteraceae bacterium]|nr:flagellar hook-basal body complex protein [Xanthobacteraceae bacterium]